jgi:ketosteroid isomerase-like protein
MLETWKDAERTGDAERLGELLTDDFVGIGPVGFVLPKDAWLGRLGPELRDDELDLDEVSVRTNGDTTIVVAHQHATGEARGNPVPPDTRVSFVVS